MAARCPVAGCDGPPEGPCIEGFRLDECPNLADAPEISDDALADELLNISSPDVSTPAIVTRRGNALNFVQADEFLRRHDGVLVALIAGHGAGKTTLTAVTYEQIRRRRLPIQFAGSETIPGFEERHALARESSGGTTPETPRTRRSSVDFLHLHVVCEDGRLQHILFCDRAGETYDEALDSPSALRLLPEIPRANLIFVLIDGSALKDRPHRTIAAARRNYQAVLQALDHGNKRIAFLVTKSDLLRGDDYIAADEQMSALANELQRVGHAIPYLFVGSRAEAGRPYGGIGLTEWMNMILMPPAVPTYQAASPDATSSREPFNLLAIAGGGHA